MQIFKKKVLITRWGLDYNQVWKKWSVEHEILIFKYYSRILF